MNDCLPFLRNTCGRSLFLPSFFIRVYLCASVVAKSFSVPLRLRGKVEFVV